MGSAFHVYCDRLGFLADDEQSWSRRITDAATFTSYASADEVGERETAGTVFYVLKSCCETDH